ncbi:MAG: lysylphosphatidylglycerol synthase domain-containing protein [Bacteroidota bacterium]
MEQTTKLVENANVLEKRTVSPPNVKHAVILAAGNGQRFREKGVELPKVLLKVGGMRLLERTILTLKEAGIEHFRIVTGAYGDQIAETLGKINRLKGLDVAFVPCPDFNLGNGMSLAAGAGPVDQPFLLTMADHVFSINMIKEFVHKSLDQEADLPALACDPDIDGVFDLDDATKVESRHGRIHNIGKQIKKYNLIDTGLFYFPKGTGPIIQEKARQGAHSVSEIVGQFIEEQGFRTISIENNFWQDVDNPSMRKEAERRLLKSLIKPTDGWVSKKINRHVSTRVSLFLSRFNVTPNMVTTFVFFFTLYGAYLAASGEYLKIALGGLIFQIASILDGCDGELARLKMLGSRFGAWYDTLTDNARYILFFGSLGYGAYQAGGPDFYFYASIIFLFLGFYVATRMAIFTWNNGGALTNLVVTKTVDDKAAKSSNWWDKIVKSLRGIDKQDVSAFIAFILCVVGLSKVMFWLVFIGSFIVSITITRTFAKASRKKKRQLTLKKPAPFVFYFFGALLLCYLIYKMDVTTVMTSLTEVGGWVFLVFATAIFWILANTMSLANLTNYKIPFLDLLYIQITGDAYNDIIPLAGLGGEPYKIKQLSNFVGLEEGSRTIVHNRLIHSLTGILFTSITGFGAVALVSMTDQWRIPILIASSVFAIVTVGMIWLTLSSVPNKLSGFVLKKLKFIDEFRNESLSPKRFAISFFWKLSARALNLLEIYAIFVVLGYSPDLSYLVMVSAMLSLSATLFFIVPQGIGVSEASVSTAFVLLGLGAQVGLIFGLLRRARIVFWALLGIAIQLTVVLIRKLMARKVQREMVK